LPLRYIFCLSLTRCPPRSPLFPYTTLFRSPVAPITAPFCLLFALSTALQFEKLIAIKPAKAIILNLFKSKFMILKFCEVHKYGNRLVVNRNGLLPLHVGIG